MADQKKIAVFGGGCFWCTEAVFLELRGVLSVMPGYAGGNKENPTYEEVCTGKTGHAEVIKIEFDPGEISYRDLLTVFFATHDPTSLNRQGDDIGTQYRSIIIYADDDQKLEAENFIKELGAGVVTELKPLAKFYDAEEYHREYYLKNPEKAYCQLVINPKLEKLEAKFGNLLKTHSKNINYGRSKNQKRRGLDPKLLKVAREGGTETPFTGKYVNEHGKGMYKCAICGTELFSSDTKFDSGTGWPSFTEPANLKHVELREDLSQGMRRIGVICKKCEAHLGHVFDDGPKEKGGKRYCINSVCLELEKDK